METGDNGGDPGPMNGKNVGFSGANRHMSRNESTHPRLQALRDAGVSIWLDTLSRELLETGAFLRWWRTPP